MRNQRRLHRLPIDPYVAVGLLAVLVAGTFFVRQPSAQRARAAARLPEVMAELRGMGVAHPLGTADRPVQVVELFDFECPACAASHTVAWPVVRRYVESGVAAYTAYDLPLPSHRAAVPAAVVGTCAEEADAARAWALRDRIFARQAERSAPASARGERSWPGGTPARGEPRARAG